MQNSVTVLDRHEKEFMAITFFNKKMADKDMSETWCNFTATKIAYVDGPVQKRKTEMTTRILLSKVVEKRETNIEARIPFLINDVGKRKTKMEYSEALFRSRG